MSRAIVLTLLEVTTRYAMREQILIDHLPICQSEVFTSLLEFCLFTQAIASLMLCMEALRIISIINSPGQHVFINT